MYTVTVEGPCVAATASVTFIEDTCATLLRMPNVFSPNGDGVNDGFGPILTGDPVDFSMLIHNRWGQLVYSTTYAKSRWDGRVEGGLVPAGTYFWVVQYGSRMDDGSIVRDTKTGAVTLMGNP
jgi:gliding motility-associated-like protein